MIKTTTKTDRKIVQILKIRVDSTREDQLLEEIGKKVLSGSKFYIVTPNPEIVLEADKDSELAEAINKADFAIPDGIGLKLVKPSLEIIHGRKLFVKLLGICEKERWKVYLVGGGKTQGLKTKLADSIRKSYPDLVFKIDLGPMLDRDGNPDTEVDITKQSDVVGEINNFKPDFVFVGFGAPKQEKWVNKMLPKLDTKGAMVIGGALDYLAKIYPLPPKWMEVLELEWVWRLLTQPWRIGRIWRAVIIFPLKVIFSKF